MIMKTNLSLLAGMVALSLSAPVWASDFAINGFVTQGAFASDRNNYFGESEHSLTFDYRELGLNGSWAPIDRLRFSSLLLSRTAGKTDDGSLRVDHALVDIALARKPLAGAGLLLGRLKTPIAMYNDTRDVAATRPSILLPQSIYFDNARKYLINYEGAAFYVQRLGSTMFTRLNVAYGAPNGIDNIETETYFLGSNMPGHLDARRAILVRLSHEQIDRQLRLVLTASKQHIGYNPGQIDFLSQGNINLDVIWASVRKDFGPVRIVAEGFSPVIEYTDFGPLFPDRTLKPLGWYVETAYFSSHKWEAFVRYDNSYLDRSDKGGARMAALTGKPAHAFFAHDVVLGGRYHFTPQFSVSAEFHAIDGTAWLPVVDNPIPSSTSRYWNLAGTQVTFTF